MPGRGSSWTTGRMRLQAVVSAFLFAVAIQVEGEGAHVRHSRQANKLLEVLGHELRSGSSRSRTGIKRMEERKLAFQTTVLTQRPKTPGEEWMGMQNCLRTPGSLLDFIESYVTGPQFACFGVEAQDLRFDTRQVAGNVLPRGSVVDGLEYSAAGLVVPRGGGNP